MIVQRFNLNLIPNQSPVIVHVNQYDTGTGRLVATLYEGNEPYSPNGTAVIQGTKPDGHGFQYTATLDGNVVTADLTEQMAPVAGDVKTQIVVTESSGVTGTFAFIIRVQPSALPSDTDMSESDYQYIEEAIREAQEAVQTAQEATETAQEAVERAEAAITETQENAEDSEAWAQGTRGGIPVEPTDPTYEHNAEYWAQYAERYAQGGLHYKASIPFADIPTTGMREGDMYDITDDFTTDSRFTEGAGIKVKGGTNIAWNSDNKWDILALPYIPKTTFNGRSGSILPMAGDYDSEKILLSSALHIGGETQSDVQEALEALSNDGVKSFNGRSGSILPMAGDYDSDKILLSSILHIGGEMQENAQEALEALEGNKADRVDNAIADNFAGLDANGNLKDSGKNASDFATPSDIAGQQSLLKDTVGWTGKNLLKNTAESGSYQGITYTVNSDKSITINGTNTDSAQHSVMVGIVTLDAGDYKVNGLKNNGGYTSFWINLYNLTDSSNIKDVKNANEDIAFTLSAPKQVRVNVYWAGNATVSNITIYPMIRKADITDPTYESYHESVEVMYEEEVHGVNLLPRFTLADLKAINVNGTWNNNVYTRNGITFTVNEDTQTVSISSGTSTAYANFRFNINLKELLKRDIPYTVNGMSNSIGRLFIYDRGADRVLSENHGGDSSFVIPSSTTFTNNIELIFDVNQNVTIQATTIRPMIRKAEIDDPAYRPYNSQAIQNQLNAQGVLGAKNLLENVATSGTSNGISYTVNSDKSISFAGTTTATSYFPISKDVSTNKFLKDGNYILSTNTPLPTGTELWLNGYVNGTYYNHVATMTAGMKEVAFTVTPNLTGLKLYIQIPHVSGGRVVSSTTIYPMIRLASDPDDTYQPYVMTNRELTEKINGTIDLSQTQSTTTPEMHVERTHLEQIGKLCILSFWINKVTISEINTWKTLFKVNKVSTKNQAFSILTGDGKIGRGLIDTNGLLTVNLFTALSNNSVIGQVIYFTN